MKNVRRVVTGTNDEGRSCVVLDEQATNFRDSSSAWRTTKIWENSSVPADNTEWSEENTRLLSTRDGCAFFYLHADPGHGVEHPAIHSTNTLDYMVIVKGEIHCMLEEDEVLLRVGDTLVQRGTQHAFVNRSDERCEMIAVAVGSHPLPDPS